MPEAIQDTHENQSLEAALSGVNPGWDFVGLKKNVRRHLSHGEQQKALDILLQASRQPDSKRALEDNVWLYHQLGEIYRANNQTEKACDMYRRAFSLEPRNLKIMLAFTDQLMASQQHSEAAEVLQTGVMYHKHELSIDNLAAVYTKLGIIEEEHGNLAIARRHFSHGLNFSPDNADLLEHLARVIAKQGESSDIIAMSTERLKYLNNAAERSDALVELGEFWLSLRHDSQRALDCFEQAYVEEPANIHALEKIGYVAEKLNDWRRVWRSYMTLSALAETSEECAQWLIKASEVARFELWDAESARDDLQRALEQDPRRLDALKSLSSILVDAEDWEGLEVAYRQFLKNYEAVEPDNKALMAIVLQKLGELYKVHLKRENEAIKTYHKASQCAPDNMELHQAVAELAEQHSDYADLAVIHLRAMLESSMTGQENLIEQLGRSYLRQKDIDAALCMFRALSAKGYPLENKAKGFVQDFQSPVVRLPKVMVNGDILAHHVLEPTLRGPITEIFALLAPILQEWVGENRSKYGLRRRDRVKTEEALVFNNLYKSIGNLLGYLQMPELWRTSNPVGLMNGALVPAGLIVSDDLLGSGNEKHAAFIIAKQLFLFLPPFYLTGVRPLSDLHGLLLRTYALFLPSDDEFVVQFAKDPGYKFIKKKLKGEELVMAEHHFSQIESIDALGEMLNQWNEELEDCANRIGLLFCDDLATCEAGLQKESQPITSRPISERMQSLIDYSIDEKYLSLRPKLGISFN